MHTGDPPRAEEHYEYTLSLARKIARGFGAGRFADLDDTEGDALIGLLKAVRDYQPMAGRAFRSYLFLRVRGEIIDGLRRMGNKRRVGERPQFVPLCEDSPRYEEGDQAEIELPAAYYDQSPSPFDLACLEERRALARGLIAQIDNPRHRHIMEEIYLNERTMREVGKALGVTESRICQLHGKALMQLRQSAGVDR